MSSRVASDRASSALLCDLRAGPEFPASDLGRISDLPDP